MTHRERALAVLRYQPCDRLPIVHFGFLGDTLTRWRGEGHITEEERRTWGDGNASDLAIGRRLGFDFNWRTVFAPSWGIDPPIQGKVLREFPDGSQHVLSGSGAVLVRKPGTKSIPAEVDHLLKDRASWESEFKSRFQFSPSRVLKARVPTDSGQSVPFETGGLDLLRTGDREIPLGLEAGSLYGMIRNMMGVENLCYLSVDDEPLYDEIIGTCAEVCFRCVEYTLATGARFDFLHFWEDIAFKNGPLVNPDVFRAKVGPHYRRITDLARRHGLDIASLDCDGCIDTLVPVWFENGVNTMFPIEVGTWHASLRPWRQRFGRELRGVGGMDKKVFAADRAGVDAEIERLRPLVDMGGYIPCPDHRIAEDAEWDLVRYYCDRMRATFG
jgi:uroporphyrinogen decarboxylase